MHERLLRDFLVDSGLLSRATVESLLNEGGDKALPTLIVERGLLSEDEMRRALSTALGIPFVVLAHEDIDPTALELIPEPVSRSRSVVAYKVQDNTLEVALLNLEDMVPLQFLEKRMRILPRLTSRDSIKRALLLYQQELKRRFGDAIVREVHSIIEPAPGASEELLRYSAERLAAARVTDLLMRHAVHQGASHMHLEYGGRGLMLRYRIGGVIHEAINLPRHAAHPVFLRLKLLSGLALKNTLPQEGRFKILFDEEEYAIRTSTMPTIDGERMVLRLVPKRRGQRAFTLESLGFHGSALESLHSALLKKSGFVAVCSPAGGGKTTTLYTMLDILHAPHRAVSTIENTIEERLPYATQTKTDPSIGFTTSKAVRSALLLDPDVVMVGEVEQEEVAELLSSAAARGALVFAGAENEKLVSKADIVVRVARVRRLCTHKPYEKTKLSRAESSALEELGADFAVVLAALKDEGFAAKDAQWKDILFARALPCEQCEEGYSGHVGLQELVGGTESSLTLLEDGIFKAAVGLTSLDEIIEPK